MKERFTAPTVEEAKALAAESFGVSVDKINFTVIEEVKKGLFRKPSVSVQAEYEPASPSGGGAAPVKVMAAEEKKAPKPEKAPEIAKPAPAPAAAEPVKPVEVVKEKAVSVPAGPEPEEAPAEAPAKPVDSKALAAKTEAAVRYIVSILEGMGLENVSATPTESDGGIIIELNADGLSEMIGKKGELLDSLQYLSSLVCNRIDREYFRITTDSCGFRARRKAQLERLAHKLANTVKKSGRTHSLEPMNPYERRIIHAAVSEVEGVTSKSVGEEPYRKVVISSTEKKPRDFKGGKGNRRGGNDRRGRYNKPKPHYDITTSFEKNYKKPKPEDDMDLGSGAYGKINF